MRTIRHSDCQTKLPKWNIALLRLLGYTLRTKNNFVPSQPGEFFFFNPSQEKRSITIFDLFSY